MLKIEITEKEVQRLKQEETAIADLRKVYLELEDELQISNECFWYD
jgi:hypothetical protein